jgi:uncharacterized delta-60 repeat protein
MNRFACLALLPLLATAAARAGDGDLDASFGMDGVARIDGVQPVFPAVAVQPDGRIVVCDDTQGDGTGYDFYVARFDADGRRDATFGVDGALAIAFDAQGFGEDFCRAVAIEPDGHIVVAGYRILADFPDPELDAIAVARINADGTLDAAFGEDGRLSFLFDGFDKGGVATSVAIDAEDRIVIAGEVKAPNYAQRLAVARIEPDGTFDATFGIGGQATVVPPSDQISDIANAVALDAAGRVWVAGVRSGDGVVMRLLADGSLDATFGDGGVAMAGLYAGLQGGSLNALAIDDEGRAVAAGLRWPNEGDYSEYSVAVRFLSDGSLDTTFGEDGIADVSFDLGVEQGEQSAAAALAIQPDGKLVLAGYANQNFPAGLLATVARLDTDGSLDTTFSGDGKALFNVSAFAHADQWLNGVAMQGTQIIAVGGNVDVGASYQGDIVLRIPTDRILASSFE